MNGDDKQPIQRLLIAGKYVGLALDLERDGGVSSKTKQDDPVVLALLFEDKLTKIPVIRQ